MHVKTMHVLDDKSSQVAKNLKQPLIFQCNRILQH